MTNRIFRLFILLLLVSCTSEPTFINSAPPTDGTGLLYIYRPETWTLSALSAVFEIDGQKVATIENNGYFVVRLAPGLHTVTERWKAGFFGNTKLEEQSTSLKVLSQAGKTSYIRLAATATQTKEAFSEGIKIGTKIHTEWVWHLDDVPDAIAIPELSKTKLSSTG